MQKDFIVLFAFLIIGHFPTSGAHDGFLFFLSFFNLTDASIPNSLTDKFVQEFFISGDAGTTVIIHDLKNRTKEVRKFQSDQTLTFELNDEYGGNSRGTHHSTIIVSALGGPISVQANKATRESGGGYLALPLSETSTEFFLASYTTIAPLASLFTLTSLIDGTCIDIDRVDSDGTSRRLNHLSLDASEIFYGSLDSDVTAVHVTSSKPIAVYSGHFCVKVPVNRDDCDHIVEQILPVREWGSVHFVSSLHGTPWTSGIIIRVVSMEAQNVTINTTSYFLQSTTLPTVTSEIIEVKRFNFTEHFVRGHASGPSVVVLECPKRCMVMQYCVGRPAPDGSNEQFGAFQDPFMMTVPSVDHYPNNVHFSTSRIFKHLPNGSYSFIEANNFVTVIVKTNFKTQVTFDGVSLSLSDPDTVTMEFHHNSESYTAILMSVTHGFHSVSSTGNVSYAVFVYGYGWKTGNSGNPTGYGYLGGFKYGVGSSGGSLIRSGPWFDTSPLKDGGNANDTGVNDTIQVTPEDLPFQIVIWNTSFCTIRPLDSIIRKKCSEGYRNYFRDKRVAYVEGKLKIECANATVSMDLLPVQYSEYTCGQIFILMKVIGAKGGRVGAVPECVNKMIKVMAPLKYWMEDGKFRVDEVIDPDDDENIADCAPVHFKEDQFALQAKGWSCPEKL